MIEGQDYQKENLVLLHGYSDLHIVLSNDFKKCGNYQEYCISPAVSETTLWIGSTCSQLLRLLFRVKGGSSRQKEFVLNGFKLEQVHPETTVLGYLTVIQGYNPVSFKIHNGGEVTVDTPEYKVYGFEIYCMSQIPGVF